MTAQDTKFSGADSAAKSSLSFLSPAIVRVNPIIDVLNASRSDDNALTKLIESKIAKNVTGADNSDQAPVPSPQFASAARKTSRSAFDKTGLGSESIAIPDQVKYFTDNYSLTTNTEKVVTLADRKNNNVQLPVEDQDAKKEKEGFNVATPTSAPMDFFTSIFQRDLSKDKDAKDRAFKKAAAENAGESFNLNNGKNYLMGVSQTAVKNLPNQIKALFMSSTGNSPQVKFNPAGTRAKDVFKDPDQSSSAKMKYKLLVEVQYLSGFETVTSEGRSILLMTAPVFRKLTATAFSRFVGKKLVCRLKKYEIPQLGITRPKKLDVPIYDEYFILEPDVPLEGIDPTDVVDDILLGIGEVAPRAGFGENERMHADISEFGTSRKPGRNKRLRSLRKKELLREIEKQKLNINSDLVADAFNSNVVQSGKFVATPTAGTLVTKRIAELKKRTRTSKRDSGERVRYVNPALTTKINPGSASVRGIAKSALAGTRLPELKKKLTDSKTELTLLEKKVSGLEIRIKFFLTVSLIEKTSSRPKRQKERGFSGRWNNPKRLWKL